MNRRSAMARKKNEPIQVRSFVTINGEYVEVDTLSPEMRRKVATQLMQLHQEQGMNAYTLAPTKNGKARTITAAPFVMAQLKKRKIT